MSGFVDKHLKKKSWLSWLLVGVSFFYKIVVAGKRKRAVSEKIQGLRIVSVGNIVCGGSGKTPFDMTLAGYLQDKGLKVAISVRGYKSELEDGVTLISDYNKVFPIAKKAGDEPLLLAESLPRVPVIVGKDRLAAVRYLQEKFADLDVIILEDSFQNFKVAHDFDFVLFKAKVGLGNGWCLPAGYLREAEQALADADCIVVDGENHQVEKLAKKYGKQLLKGKITTRGFFAFDNSKVSEQKLKSGVCYSVSAIADPRAFEEKVEEAGIYLAKKFAFDDHHHFQDLSLHQLRDADYLLVTDKDMVKLRVKESIREKLVSLRIDYQLDLDKVRGLL